MTTWKIHNMSWISKALICMAQYFTASGSHVGCPFRGHHLQAEVAPVGLPVPALPTATCDLVLASPFLAFRYLTGEAPFASSDGMDAAVGFRCCSLAIERVFAVATLMGALCPSRASLRYNMHWCPYFIMPPGTCSW